VAIFYTYKNMGLSKNFNEHKLNAYFENVRKKHIERFKYYGEMFVNLAKETGEYTDRTGNLRSSIGYVIAYNGNIIEKYFENAIKGTDRETGKAGGSHLAKKLLLENRTGLVLICVAGMNYAAAVEGRERDVITKSTYNVASLLKKAISKTI
jgi:hypothetical protein